MNFLLRVLTLAVSVFCLHLFVPCASAREPGTPPAAPSTAGVRFEVSLAPALGDQVRSGRLIVLTIRDGSRIPPAAQPVDGPFWTDPQPLFAIDVKDAGPGSTLVLDASADGFPVAPDKLPPGKYRAQARLDTTRESSSWRDHDGNLFGPPVAFEVPADGQPALVRLALDTTTTRGRPALPQGVSVVEVVSPSLRSSQLRDIPLRATVIPPIDMQPDRAYPAIYEVPGFGGDHLDGLDRRVRQRASADPASSEGRLARAAFLIILEPESRNGHTLFADSFNNGDRGRALITELLPAIEKAHPLIPKPTARVLRGHSSGGWSVLWLLMNYSSTFGFAWSTAPDPVDFRSFQGVNIYQDANMFLTSDGKERPSFVRDGVMLMSIRQENGGEGVIGPDNSSAQQWDSWLAVWGPRNARGKPADLFDPRTGQIDAFTAKRFRTFDIGLRFRDDQRRHGPLFRDRARIVVGSADEFGLDKSVALFKQDLDAWMKTNPPPADAKAPMLAGIQILEGKTHGSVLQTPEVRAFSSQMLEYFKAHGHAP